MGSWYTPEDCSVPISAISIYNYCVETAGNFVWVQRRSVALIVSPARLSHGESGRRDYGFECRFDTQGGEQLKREHTSQWLQNGNVSCTRNTYLLICADMQNRLTVCLWILYYPWFAYAAYDLKFKKLHEPRPLLLQISERAISPARMRHCI